MGVTIQPRDVERLAEFAAELEISRSELVRRILEPFLVGETWARKGPCKSWRNQRADFLAVAARW